MMDWSSWTHWNWVAIINGVITLGIVIACIGEAFHLRGQLKETVNKEKARRQVWSTFIMTAVLGSIVIVGIYLAFNLGAAPYLPPNT